VKQAEIDAGRTPGTSASDAQRIIELEREVCKPRRETTTVIATSIFFATELDGRPKR
jgi:hypothetical protein